MRGWRTYRAEVDLHQVSVAEEAVVQSRHVATDDEEHDARVIQLVAPFRDLRGMVAEGMVSGGHAETGHGASEEAGEDEEVGGRCGLIAGGDDGVQERPAKEEGDGAEEVGPDVDGLVMEVAQAFEGAEVGVRVWAVAGDDEGVVAAPVGKVVPEDEEGALDFVFEGCGFVFYRLENGPIGVTVCVVSFAVFEAGALGGCGHFAR